MEILTLLALSLTVARWQSLHIGHWISQLLLLWCNCALQYRYRVSGTNFLKYGYHTMRAMPTSPVLLAARGRVLTLHGRAPATYNCTHAAPELHYGCCASCTAFAAFAAATTAIVASTTIVATSVVFSTRPHCTAHVRPHFSSGLCDGYH